MIHWSTDSTGTAQAEPSTESDRARPEHYRGGEITLAVGESEMAALEGEDVRSGKDVRLHARA